MPDALAAHDRASHVVALGLSWQREINADQGHFIDGCGGIAGHADLRNIAEKPWLGDRVGRQVDRKRSGGAGGAAAFRLRCGLCHAAKASSEGVWTPAAVRDGDPFAGSDPIRGT